MGRLGHNWLGLTDEIFSTGQNGPGLVPLTCNHFCVQCAFLISNEIINYT